MNANLFEFFREGFGSHLDRPFLRRTDGKALPYADLALRSGRLATLLRELGVEPGDRVAVQAEKSADNVFLFAACLRAGAVYLPLNNGYTQSEIGYFLNDAEPALFVCDPRDAELARATAKEAGGVRVETMGADQAGTLLEMGQDLDPEGGDVERSPDDLAAILYTSGTTGKPKGAMLSHRNLSSNIEALVQTWRFSHVDKLLHALPIFHTHGLFVAVGVALRSGCEMLFLPRFDAGEMVRLMPEATTMMGVPTFYSRLLARPELDEELTKNVRLFVSGSAPLSAEVHKEWFERTGHAILERYGMSETCMLTSNPYDEERRPGTVGMPLPGVELRVADPESGDVLPQGEVGAIQVRGPNVFQGYWRNPDKTKAEFTPDGWFKTGDLGVVSEDGYVSIVGRDKDLVISGGYNVYPAEVEALIDALPEVAESAVIGLPHPDLGEGVTAVVALKQDAKADESSLIQAVKGELAGYKRPKRVLFVKELPRNTMGKIQKAQLREEHKGLYGGG